MFGGVFLEGAGELLPVACVLFLHSSLGWLHSLVINAGVNFSRWRMFNM